MRATSALVAATAVAALAGPAQAQLSRADQFSTRPVRVGFAGGVVVPRTGATVQKVRTGLHGQGFLLIQLPGLPALRANVDYAKMSIENPQVDGARVADAEADRTVLDGVLSLKLDLLRAGPLRPYLLAGVGAFNVKDVVDATSGSTQSFSDTNLGLDGGVGLAFKLGPITGFAESRLQNVYTKERGLVDTKTIQSFPVVFGLVF